MVALYMKRFLIITTALVFSCTAFASKEKDRRLYEYRWYTIESIKEYVQTNRPKNIGWIFPAGRKYILEGEGEHSPELTKVNIDSKNYRSGGQESFIYKPEKKTNLAQEIEKICMTELSNKLRWIGGESGGFSHFKKYRYEVVGIESHELVMAPLDVYYSKSRPIRTKTPDSKNSILCSVYSTPQPKGKVLYEAVVILTAKAAYSDGVK